MIRFRSVLAGLWLLLTLTLAAWWMVFGLRQINRLSQLNSRLNAHVVDHLMAKSLVRQQQMLFGEGSVFIVLLLVGGGALIYLVHRETVRNEQIKDFFANYTHDLKTSLASLRLQAEALKEDLLESPHAKVVTRLIKDTVRLELQLENSLLMAGLSRKSQLFMEDLNLTNVVQSFGEHWPDLEVRVPQDVVIRADSRALESVLKNLIHNAIVHGEATRVELIAIVQSRERIVIQVCDNGRGFKGDRKRLGALFVRHSPTSGTGVGLYVAGQLMKRMGGSLEFQPTHEGFGVQLFFRGHAV